MENTKNVEEMSEDIKKVPSTILRLLLRGGLSVICILFGMLIRENTGGNEIKRLEMIRLNEVIAAQATVITALRKDLSDCKDARYADKEYEYQRLLRRQAYADSIQNIAKKLKEQ